MGGRMDGWKVGCLPTNHKRNLHSDYSIQALMLELQTLTKLKIPDWGSNPPTFRLLVHLWGGWGVVPGDVLAVDECVQTGYAGWRANWEKNPKRLKTTWLLLSITPHKSRLSLQKARCVGLHFHNCIWWGKRRTYSYFQLRFIKASDSSRRTRSFISAMTFIWAEERLPSLFSTFSCLRSPLVTLCLCDLTTIAYLWKRRLFLVNSSQRHIFELLNGSNKKIDESKTINSFL